MKPWPREFRRQTGLLDHGILVQQRPDPAQIDGIGLDRPAADHDARIRRKIRDGVEYLARRAGITIGLLDAGVT